MVRRSSQQRRFSKGWDALMAADSADKAASLEEIRWRIDAIDSDLLRLIDERSGLAAQVAAAKKAQATPGQPLPFGLRPDRETQVLRGLLAKPRDHASAAQIVRLWRDLMGDNLARQGNFRIALCPGREAGRMTELVRLRFGGTPAIDLHARPEQALAAAKQNGVVAVAPLNDGAWWGRILAEPSLRVFAALPCLLGQGAVTALAVAAVDVEPTGGDDTFWVTDAAQPSAAIEAALAQDGVAASMLAQANGLKLFTLAGFYQADDPRLARAPGALSGVIGATPTPLDL
jgi:chorismate mutase